MVGNKVEKEGVELGDDEDGEEEDDADDDVEVADELEVLMPLIMPL